MTGTISKKGQEIVLRMKMGGAHVAERKSLRKMSAKRQAISPSSLFSIRYTRVGTLIVGTIYLQLIQNRYMFRSFTVLQCSHQRCVQPVASDVEVVGYL